MAVSGQRAGAALVPGGGEVVEDQGAVFEVAPGQSVLDPLLAREKPVHGFVDVVLVDVFESEDFTERRAQGVVVQAAHGGELGLRCDDAGNDQCDDDVAHAARGAIDQRVQLESAQGAEDRGDVSVGAASDDLEGVGRSSANRSALEDGPQCLDLFLRPVGEVGQGTLSDALSFPPAFAQQDGGVRFAVGDALDVHGNHIYHVECEFNG